MKKLLLLLFVLFISNSIFAQVPPQDTDGDGYFNIVTLENLLWLSEARTAWHLNYELDNDIDASDTKTWYKSILIDTLIDTIIVPKEPEDPENPPDPPEWDTLIDITFVWDTLWGFLPIGRDSMEFMGNFEGHGFSIENLYIDEKNHATLSGFFGIIGYDTLTMDTTHISNLTLINCEVHSINTAAGLIGSCTVGKIENCHVSGTIEGVSNTAGLIGAIGYGIITNCSANCDIVGQNFNGGLIGSLSAGKIVTSYANCNLNTVNQSAGFISSLGSEGIIDQCYASGSIKAGTFVGGFSSNNSGHIQNCYTLSTIRSTQYAGGFTATNTGTIKDCYSKGLLLAPSNVGGFVAINDGVISTSFWDIKVSGWQSSAGGFGLMTTDMKKLSTFIDAEWDFATAWDMNEYVNEGYPFLQKFVYKLAKPIQIVPVQYGVDIDLLPEFHWQDVPDANRYFIQISEDETFEEIMIEENVIESEFLPESRFTEELILFWRVKAYNDADSSAWSSAWKFTTEDIIDPPIIIAPANNETGVLHIPIFTWSDLYDAGKYHLQLSIDSTFELLLIDLTVQDTSIESNAVLGESTTFYWRVNAEDAEDISFWSEIYSFTTKGPVDAPELEAPYNGERNVKRMPLFQWDPGNGGSYNLEISEDEGFNEIVLSEDLDENFFLLTDVENILDEHTLYFWRVNSVNGTNVSEWSDIFKFTTMYAPIALTSPINNLVNIALDTPLKWEEHSAAGKYQLQIAIAEDFEEANVIETSTSFPSEYLPTLTEVYSDYFWRVRVETNDTTWGEWSEIWKFKTGIETVEIFYPEDGDNTINFKNETFRWNAVQGAEFYQLQISINSDFTNLAFSRDSIRSTSYKVDKLIPEKDYFWRVKAWNTESKSSPQWSSHRSITTIGTTIDLFFPTDESSDISIPETLRWNSVPVELDNFELQIATDKDFTDIKHEKEKITAPSYIINSSKIPDLEEYTMYHWRVRTKVSSYLSEWTESWSFTTSTVSVIDIAKEISILPQPANDYLNVVITGLTASISEYMLIDITGNAVITENIYIGNGNHTINIDITNITNGKYFILLKSKKGAFIKEVVIVK